jgi:hypothetical protein
VCSENDTPSSSCPCASISYRPFAAPFPPGFSTTHPCRAMFRGQHGVEPRPSSYVLRFVSDPRNAPSMLNDVRPAFRQISLDAPVSFAREWRLAHEPAPEIRRRCMTSIPCGSVWATSAPFLRLGARLQSLPSRVSERPVQLAAANSPAGLALDMSFREGRGWPESVKAGSAKLTGRT